MCPVLSLSCNNLLPFFSLHRGAMGRDLIMPLWALPRPALYEPRLSLWDGGKHQRRISVVCAAELPTWPLKSLCSFMSLPVWVVQSFRWRCCSLRVIPLPPSPFPSLLITVNLLLLGSREQNEGKHVVSSKFAILLLELHSPARGYVIVFLFSFGFLLCFILSGWMSSKWIESLLPACRQEHVPGFYVSSEDMNSGFHTCQANILSTEPPP